MLYHLCQTPVLHSISDVKWINMPVKGSTVHLNSFLKIESVQ